MELCKIRRDIDVIPNILKDKLNTKKIILAWIDEDEIINFHIGSMLGKDLVYLQKCLNNAVDQHWNEFFVH